ncbi:MAG: carbohydrate binding domain-containing protein, partial [Armatimonadota bacterium]
MSLRGLLTAAALLGFPTAATPPGEAQPTGRQLLPNGGFEDGTTGWRVAIGPYGEASGGWEASARVAEVVAKGAREGRRCLQLNAGQQPGEIDVYSLPVNVNPGRAHWLSSRVRQIAGGGNYKVVIDWRDANGKHIRYDNDWKGHDRPKEYRFHGGLFVSPEDAREAVIILGVAKGVEALFDEVALIEADIAEEALAPAPDGEGEATWEGPRRIDAGAFATFRLRFTVGESGLPPGARIGWRRSNVDPRWSPPQTSDPTAEGYTTVNAPDGAIIRLEPGDPKRVPCINWLVLEYPRLKAGDVIEIVYGDTSGGGPGARVQSSPEGGICFIFNTDGDRDGRGLDVPDTGSLAVVPGEAKSLAIIAPSVVSASDRVPVTVEARDALGNRTLRLRDTVHLTCPEGSKELSLGSDPERAGDAARSVPPPPSLQEILDARGASVPVAFRQPGTATIRATAGALQATTDVLVLPPSPSFAKMPEPARARREAGWFVIRNRHLALCVPDDRNGAEAGLLFSRDGSLVERAASVTFGEVRAKADGRDIRVPIVLQQGHVVRDADAPILQFDGSLDVGGTRCDVRAEFGLSAWTGSEKSLSCSLSLTPKQALPLTAFYGPALRVGDGRFGRSKRTALFPCLEYLVGDEPSSGTYGAVPPHSDRWAPHPFKHTIPLMAVAAERVTAGMFWDPLQKYDGEHAYPTAWFASPSRKLCPGAPSEDRANHFMTIFAPSVLDGLRENAPELEQPRVIPAGSTLNLKCSIFALAGSHDVTDAVDYWLRVNGLPELPPKPRSYDRTAELIVRGLVGPAWDEEERGWHNALADPWGAGYNAGAAFEVWKFRQRNPRHPLNGRIDEILTACEEKYGALGGFELALYRGDALAAVASSLGAARDSISAQSPDGSWAYHPHTGNKSFSQAQARVIGKDGEVCVGTCLMAMEPVVKAARLTGAPDAVASLFRGLDFIERYSRPQGAENWEVPLACPNLRAAALAVDAYVAAYELTGERKYLQRAIFWAKTGMPFIYLWKARERDIMPYASISVMGTTFYTHEWFGRPVQWVGLVYAEALTRLARHDRNEWWPRLAEGILVAAMQMQQIPAQRRQRWGFYPDAWDVVRGDEAYVWDLSPQRVASLLAEVANDASQPTTGVLRAGESTIHVTASGTISDLVWRDKRLTFSLWCRLGVPHQCVVVGVSRPMEVRVAGEAARPTSEAYAPPGGWRYDEAACALVIGLPASGTPVQLAVLGVEPKRPRPVPLADAIQNGGFEEGLWAWSGAPADHVRTVREARSGQRALLLDAVGVAVETQATSAPMIVEEGATYELVSYVTCVEGAGDYKVTIDWLGDAGHIAYANDWKGTDAPADWTLHGGRFTAPAGAQRARLILG